MTQDSESRLLFLRQEIQQPLLFPFRYALGGHHRGADLWRRVGLGRGRHDGPPGSAEEVILSDLFKISRDRFECFDFCYHIFRVQRIDGMDENFKGIQLKPMVDRIKRFQALNNQVGLSHTGNTRQRQRQRQGQEDPGSRQLN